MESIKEILVSSGTRMMIIMVCVVLLASCSRKEGMVEPDPVIQSRLISKVFDFLQAPGQLVNTTPVFNTGDNRDSMISRAGEALVGRTDGLLSLGGYGGYVVFGFDHLVINKKDKRDFKIYGNAFEDLSEPGIVEVSFDANGNSLPDDEWFELAGSQYNDPNTIKNYSITYTKPDPLDDSVSWQDNQGNSGKILRNEYHTQESYFPLYFNDQHLTFNGTLLPGNAVNNGTSSAEAWVLPAYSFGYADNHPNISSDAALDIDWAVNSRGEKAELTGIHFVRVYTGVNQHAGWLGESSTEIGGAEDLNLQ